MPPKTFFVADLNTKGELHAQTEYAYDTLLQLPGCAEMVGAFSSHLYNTPDEFETQLPYIPAVKLRWRSSAPTAGIATLRVRDELASLSLLCTGLNPDADRLTLDAFQKHLLRELHDTGFEPSFALLDLKNRPLIATINFHSPPEDIDRLAVALADRCFAASYFRYHALA